MSAFLLNSAISVFEKLLGEEVTGTASLPVALRIVDDMSIRYPKMSYSANESENYHLDIENVKILFGWHCH